MWYHQVTVDRQRHSFSSFCFYFPALCATLCSLWLIRKPLNDYLLSVLLGIIEGLTEFLPVSSTAHLRIAEALVHINLSDGYWKMYTIVIQLGAILCLPVYFRSRISAFLGNFPGGVHGD